MANDLSQLSIGLNSLFGDQTGRSITKTTMDGASKFGVKIDSTETHVLMGVAGLASFSDDPLLRGLGKVTTVGLSLLYLAGR